MKKVKKFWLMSFLCIMFCGFAFLGGGCAKDSTIELYQQDNVYEVVPGGELQFKVKLENVEEKDVEYLVESGAATFSETGLLTVDEDAEVATVISVYAQAGDVKSNTLNINVIDLKPQSISLTSSKSKLVAGARINFDVTYTPSNSTIRDYTLSIAGGNGQEYVDLNDNVLTMKTGIDEDDVVDKTVEVKATLTADTSISSTVTIKLVKTIDVETLMVSNINYNVAKDANKFMQVSAYNAGDYLIETELDDFTYTSSDANIAVVDDNGRIIPKGHGKATITVEATNGKTTTCDVFVMIPPTSLGLDNVSSLIADKKEMSYSRLDALKLDFDFETNSQFVSCSNAVDYEFALLNDEGEEVSTGTDVATVDANGITFATTGRVKITITSNSSLNNVNTSDCETDIEVIVNVNEGINIDTVAEFKAFADQTKNSTTAAATNVNRVVNINSDLYLTETENFGLDDNNYFTLNFYGDVVINGNGYVLSNSRLPLIIVDGDGNEGSEFLRFNPFIDVAQDPNTPEYTVAGGYAVEVYDLSVIGCGSVSALYNGELEEFAGMPVVNHFNGKYIRTYDRGILIRGGDYKNGKSNTYVSKLTLSGVEVTGFDTGMRIEHAVDALLTDCKVSNCVGNGIESIQNLMTINNLTVRQVGAFAIELTPDDMDLSDDSNPKGTAGVEYNQTNKLTLTGSIDCENYNNGASTPYMEAFKLGDYNLVQVADLIGLTTIQMIMAELGSGSPELKNQLLQVYNNVLKADRDKDDEKESLNLYLLIFVNTQKEFSNYNKLGNTTGKFAEYSFKQELDDEDKDYIDMINMTEILKNQATAFANGQTYEGYKQYKYICIDLNTGDLAGNIGQMIVVNEAYDPNYVPNQDA